MEIILTDDEKAADNWLSWDDETVGKAVRACAIALVNDEPHSPLYAHAAALILCSMAHKVNATTSTMVENGVTISGKPIGNYRITIEHCDEPFPVNPPHADYEGDKLVSVGYNISNDEVSVPSLEK